PSRMHERLPTSVVGVDGRGLDDLPLRSPIFGRRSCPPGVIRQAAFAVKRIDCRLSRFDLKRGAPMRGRLPFSPSKKFLYAVSRSRRDCWRITAETSLSQARSGVFLAAVRRLDSSAEVT